MANGAAISLTSLLEQRNRCARIQPTRQSPAFSQLSGASRANYRGRGLDFEEVRHYQPGDEPRTIDWRITARSGQTHTRIYREERERPIMLVVDQRNNMRFGSRRCFKSVQAAQIAALMGWAALANHDRVGGLVFADHQHRDFRPSTRRNSLLNMLTTLAEYNNALLRREPASGLSRSVHSEQLNPSIAELRQLARPGMAIFLVSDFQGISDESFNTLAQLRRHCDITAIQVYDPMEARLPEVSGAWYSDGAQQLQLESNKNTQRRFAERFEQQQQRLIIEMANRGITTLPISTADSARSLLEVHFPRRVRNRNRNRQHRRVVAS